MVQHFAFASNTAKIRKIFDTIDIISEKIFTFAVDKTLYAMEQNFAIQLFEKQKVRVVWDAESETVTNCHQLKILATDGS